MFTFIIGYCSDSHGTPLLSMCNKSIISAIAWRAARTAFMELQVVQLAVVPKFQEHPGTYYVIPAVLFS